MPELNIIGLIGSVAYADGQFDDARYNITLVQTFTEAGGNALNHAKVKGFLRDSSGKLSGVVISDELTDTTFNINANVVVNATGPVADSIRKLATPSAHNRMRPSKGAHILLPIDFFPTEDALLIPQTEDGRVLFAVPWGGRLLVGTTDEEVAAGTELVVTKEDVEYLLRHLNRYLARPAKPDDIVSGFAGARPLVGSDDSGDTKKLARDDVIEVDAASGLIRIMGGKWTTHRAMAEDTIDRVQEFLGDPHTEAKTRNVILFGGKGFTDDYWTKLSPKSPLSAGTARHLASKFGTAAENVLAVSGEDRSLGELIVKEYPAIRAEVIYAIRQEMAATIEDVLARRIGLQFYSWRDAIAAAPAVGALMASELNWSSSYTEAATSGYVTKICHLLDCAGLPQVELQHPSAAKAGP